jgi:hypothetical protein
MAPLLVRGNHHGKASAIAVTAFGLAGFLLFDFVLFVFELRAFRHGFVAFGILALVFVVVFNSRYQRPSNRNISLALSR